MAEAPQVVSTAQQKGTGRPVPRVVKGFMQFVHQYGIAALAIGVVIGNAVNDLVKKLVESLISPLIALITPEGQLQDFQVTFHGATFKIGTAIDAVISFLVIALMVYLLAVYILRNEKVLEKK